MAPFVEPSLPDIWAAARRIAPYARQTPVMRARSLESELGCEIHCKCENFQRTGAFKFRGAVNAVFSLGDESAARGVATHSSGNHAAALALAARLRGIAAHTVMPEDTVAIKVELVRRYGGRVVFCAPKQDARIATLAAVVAATGAEEIHPFADPRVIAGQGTAALELIREVGALDALVAPISGGGLLAGSAIAATAMCPGIAIYGAEPEGADDAARSFALGQLVRNHRVDTICDGLRADLGAPNFAILRGLGTRILPVSDVEVLAALRLVYERLKLVIEPSGAAPLAAILRYPAHFRGRRVGVILSGGNVDLAAIGRIWATAS